MVVFKARLCTARRRKLGRTQRRRLRKKGHNKIKLEYDIASDIRGLRENIQLTELKNFTIALSVFIVVDNHI